MKIKLTYGIVLSCLFICNTINVFANTLNTGNPEITSIDTTVLPPESKVDFLLQVYFSGDNKEGLLNKIDLTLGQIEALQPFSTLLAKQYQFLNGLQTKAPSAENACDILEMVATCIYGLDATEAINQGVTRPSDKTKTSMAQIMGSVDAIGNTASGVSGNAAGVGYSLYSVTNGNLGVLNTTGDIMRGANAVGNTANAVSEVGKTVEKGKELLKGLGIGGGDKPCKKVTPKYIAIGNHTVNQPPQQISNEQVKDTAKTAPATAAASCILNIKNISYGQLSTLTDAITKIQGVTGVNTDSFNNNTASISVNSSYKVMDLVNAIMKANTGINLNIDGFANNTANFTVK